jgi:hypothetical protein
LPIKTRLAILELDIPSFDSIMDYAIKNNWHETVISFLSANNDYIFIDKSSSEGYIVVPRSWEQVSNIMHSAEVQGKRITMPLLYSILGGIAQEFHDTIMLSAKIQSPEELIENGFKYSKVDKGITAYAVTYEIIKLVRHLVYELKLYQKNGEKANDAKFNEYVTYFCAAADALIKKEPIKSIMFFKMTKAYTKSVVDGCEVTSPIMRSILKSPSFNNSKEFFQKIQCSK